MSDAVNWNGRMPAARSQQQGQQPARQSTGGGGDNLADILERVLDKGIVIAGDIQINLLDIELLTIKLRLVVASVDRAKEMGIDWWERDPTLSSGYAELEEENRRLRDELSRRDGGGPAAIEDAEVDDAEVEDAEVDEPGADPEGPDEAELESVGDDADDADDAVDEPPRQPRPRRRRTRA